MTARLVIGAWIGVMLGWALLAWVLTRHRGGPTTWD